MIFVSGYELRAGGASAAEELAFVVAQGIERLRAAGEAAPGVRLQFSVGGDFFEEIAKLRAARRLWARLTEESLGALRPVRIEARTAGVALDPDEPHENVVRATLAALAAALGGADSIDAGGWLAERIGQVIEHESGVGPGSDPLAGSFYLEELTGDLERRALDRIRTQWHIL